MKQAHPAEILCAYERLAEATARMRVAASAEDWDRVIALEAECATAYTALASAETSAPGDAKYQSRKTQLIARLLEDDADIRDRVSSQMTAIWRLIDGRPRLATLNKTYGSAADAYGARGQ